MPTIESRIDPNRSAGSPSEWRSGGVVLLTAMVCASCISLPIVVLGTLVQPLSELYGWSRASISSAILMTAIGTLFFAPLIGIVVDKVGARRVGLVGLTGLGLAVIGIGLTGPSVGTWYLAWAVFAAIQPAAGFIVWGKGVTSYFDRNLGLALAVMFMGTSIAISILPWMTVMIMASFGWRAVYFALGAFVLLVVLPLAAKFFFIPASPFSATHDAAPENLSAGSEIVEVEGLTLRETLATRQFWQLVFGALASSAGISVIYVHMQPMLIDFGAPLTAAAAVVVVVGPASLIGRFGSGFLVDRLPGNLVTAAFLVCPAIGFFLLIGFDGSYVTAAIIAILGGIAQGAESDLLAFLTRRYFGRLSFSTIYGFILGAYSIGFGFAPTLAGWAFDTTGSYAVVLLPFGICCLCGAVFVATMGKSRYALAPHRP